MAFRLGSWLRLVVRFFGRKGKKSYKALVVRNIGRAPMSSDFGVMRRVNVPERTGRHAHRHDRMYIEGDVIDAEIVYDHTDPRPLSDAELRRMLWEWQLLKAAREEMQHRIMKWAMLGFLAFILISMIANHQIHLP
jgi:hypothetical protein